MQPCVAFRCRCSELGRRHRLQPTEAGEPRRPHSGDTRGVRAPRRRRRLHKHQIHGADVRVVYAQLAAVAAPVTIPAQWNELERRALVVANTIARLLRRPASKWKLGMVIFPPKRKPADGFRSLVVNTYVQVLLVFLIDEVLHVVPSYCAVLNTLERYGSGIRYFRNHFRVVCFGIKLFRLSARQLSIVRGARV